MNGEWWTADGVRARSALSDDELLRVLKQKWRRGAPFIRWLLAVG
jgi:hypothetical protein